MNAKTYECAEWLWDEEIRRLPKGVHFRQVQLYTCSPSSGHKSVCVCVCVSRQSPSPLPHKRQNNSVVKCCRSQGRTKVHLAPFKSSKVPPEGPNTCGAVKDTAGVFSVTAGAAHSKRHALSLTEQNSENHFLTVLAWKASMETPTVCYSHEG